MLTDYKFSYIKKDENGFITEAKIRFYEGEVSAKDEIDNNRELKSVIRYRRSAVISENIYTPQEFGAVQTEIELGNYLMQKLKKDISRQPIEEQKDVQ